MTCKKQRAATIEQMMSALPAFRTTTYEPCFTRTYTGVDYFGPLNIKKPEDQLLKDGEQYSRA